MSFLTALIDPLRHYHAWRDLVDLLRRHRDLIWEMTRREISERYAGQVLGTLWAVGHPLLTIAIYIFIFGYVFKIRMGGTADLPLNYTGYLLSGMIPWLTFSEAMNKSVSTIIYNTGLVKQIVFPVEILPIKVVLAALISQLIATTLFFSYVVITYHLLPWTYLLLPILMLLQFAAMVGMAYIFSAVGAYFRDLKDFILVFTGFGLFVAPILFHEDAVPAPFLFILYLNPFSHMVWSYQDALFYGRINHPWAWVIFILTSLSLLSYGYRLFRRLKGGFGDML
jgi:lipopolysaccharide transport system permease protein